MGIIFLLGPGILNKSSSSLQPVPEFPESKIQRADSNLETVESEVHYLYSIHVMCSLTFTLHLTVPNQGWEVVDWPWKKQKNKKQQQQQQQKTKTKTKTSDDSFVNYFSDSET